MPIGIVSLIASSAIVWPHLSLLCALTIDQRHDLEWHMVNQGILSWIYNSIYKDVIDIIVRVSYA
jgi:hypothetical protein